MATGNPLTAGHFNLHRDAHGRLVLIDAQGREHIDVEPVRCFPVTHPDRWIAICGAKGNEIIRIEDPSQLPGELRAILDEELTGHEFVPVLSRIVDAEEGSEYYQWKAETDRGPITFQTADDSAVRRLGPDRAMIIDTCGIRYLVPSIAAMDRTSRRILDRYL